MYRLSLDTRLLSFVSIAAAVGVASLFIARALPAADHPGAVAMGLTFDLTIGIPLAYYLLLVRGRGWPLASVGLVFLLCVAAASLVVPAQHQELLDLMWLVIPVVELGLVGYVMGRAYRIVRQASRRADHDPVADLYDRSRTSLQTALDSRTVANVLAYEVSLLYYALLFWRAKAPKGRAVYTYTKTSGYGAVVGVMLLVGIVEIAAVHILLAQWSTTAAWIHFGVSLYGLVWLWGDYQATRLRPIRIEGDTLYLRFGIRWDVRIPFTDIHTIESATHRALRTMEDEPLTMTALGAPTLIVRTKRPVRITGPYGFLKETSAIAFDVDDREHFLRAVSAALP